MKVFQCIFSPFFRHFLLVLVGADYNRTSGYLRFLKPSRLFSKSAAITRLKWKFCCSHKNRIINASIHLRYNFIETEVIFKCTLKKNC